MGGCRCTYRNCTVRSDGQTHMFHYPVFDRPRCHQWLTNAHRLDFLDLKVSQLKNRVVCQHHFKDDYFMNFKKEKLKFHAVPTEDGPYCDSSNLSEPVLIPEVIKNYPLSTEDIENEHLSCKEKRANFSVKYGDFLTNGEMMDPFFLNNTNVPMNANSNNLEEARLTVCSHINRISLPPKSKNKHSSQPMLVVQPFSNHSSQIPGTPGTYDNVHFEVQLYTDKISVQNTGEQMDLAQLSQIRNTQNKQPARSNNRIRIISEKKISEPVSVKGKLEPVSPSLILRARNTKQEVDVKPTDEDILKNKVEVEIEFLDKSENAGMQQVESFPVPFESQIIQNDITSLLKTKQQTESDTMTLQSYATQSDIASLLHTMQQVDPLLECQKEENVTLTQKDVQHFVADPGHRLVESSIARNATSPLKISNSGNNLNTQTLPNVQKSKIPPERIAAIEEKRKINKLKLRDMIEFCLDELEEQDLRSSEKITLKNNAGSKNICEGIKLENNVQGNLVAESFKPERNIKVIKNNTGTLKEDLPVKKMELANINPHGTLLLKEPEAPNFPGYNLASLEARLIRMENTLLKKIDNNSQRIVDLKNTLSSGEKRSITTQTSEGDESYKKHIFNEISIFLSPEANSLIYEELFLDKYAQSKRKSSSDLQNSSTVPKRRRR